MKKAANILFGFNSPEFIEGVMQSLSEQDYQVNYAVRTTKGTIRDFVRANENVDTIVLLEVVPKFGTHQVEHFLAEELAQLTDEKDINVIVVLNENLVGTDYMRILYQAGITSAIYQTGRKAGATISAVVELIKNKRTRKDARKYYQIDRKPADHSTIDNDEIIKKIELMTTAPGEELISCFVEIIRCMPQKHVAALIKALPSDVRDELIKYEEFHIVINFLKKCGLDLKIKQPKILQIGLKHPEESKPLLLTDLCEAEGFVQYKLAATDEDFFEEAEEPEVVSEDEMLEYKEDTEDDVLQEHINLASFFGYDDMFPVGSTETMLYFEEPDEVADDSVEEKEVSSFSGMQDEELQQFYEFEKESEQLTEIVKTGMKEIPEKKKPSIGIVVCVVLCITCAIMCLYLNGFFQMFL